MEGPFSSGSACQSALASLSGSLSTRGCGSRCFNPQPCVSAGQPDELPLPTPASAPMRIHPDTAQTAPAFDPSPERVRRSDEGQHGKEKIAPHGPHVTGGSSNSASRYQT